MSVAWVIPSHLPRRTIYLEHLKSSAEYVHSIDKYVVLSSRSEFLSLDLPKEWNVSPLFLSDWFSEDEIYFFVVSRSIINVKKIFALNILRSLYKRIIVTDDEVRVFSQLTANDILSHEFRPFPMHITTDPSLRRIIASPLALLNSREDRSWLIRNIVSEGLYGWFADVPIYDSADLTSFLKRFGLDQPSGLFRLTYETFDYILYQYHSALENKNFSTLNVLDWESPSAACSWFEYGHQNSLGREYLAGDGQGRSSLWIASPQLEGFYPNARMVFHTDRVLARRSLFTRIKSRLFS